MTIDEIKAMAEKTLGENTNAPTIILLPPVILRYKPTRTVVKTALIGKDYRVHKNQAFVDGLGWTLADDLEPL